MAMRISLLDAMVRAHLVGDHNHFVSLGYQAAAEYAGKAPVAANAIKKQLDASPRVLTNLKNFAVPGQPSVIQKVESEVRLEDVQLRAETKDKLNLVLKEQAARDRLREVKLTPINKILLVGPSGCGKTMTASALASEMGFPLFSLTLAEVIGKYLGDTSQELAKVFNYMKMCRAVYLFDEIDSLGSMRRGDSAADTEMSRVVCSTLQMLDNPPANDSLIVAATNRLEALDPALVRRFDIVLRYPEPDGATVRKAIEAKVKKHLGDSWTLSTWFGDKVKGINLARIINLVERELKACVMNFESIGFNEERFWETVEDEHGRL